MLPIRPLFCIFFCIASVSCQRDHALQKLIENLQKDENCDYSFLEQKFKQGTLCSEEFLSKFAMLYSRNLSPGDITEQVCQVNLTKCKAVLGDDLEKCLHEENYRTYFENPITAAYGMQRYACSEGGKPLEEFIINGMPCFQSEAMTEDLNKCGQSMAEEYENISPVIMFDANMVKLCRLQTDLGACIISAANTCEYKTTKNFIKNIMIKAFEATCKNDVGKISSATTPSQIKTLSFISIIIAILHSVWHYL